MVNQLCDLVNSNYRSTKNPVEEKNKVKLFIAKRGALSRPKLPSGKTASAFIVILETAGRIFTVLGRRQCA